MGEIGEELRERRMTMKIDVHEVEETTKIRAKYLRALENEEYDLLPGPAYVKSFLRTYADYLGLDSRGILLLLAADPTAFKLLDQRQVADSESWAHLAICGDELFVRDLKGISAFRWK